MNVSGIGENATSVLLNICVKSVAVGVLTNNLLTWKYLQPMYEDIKSACADENFPRRLHRDPGNELDLALRKASLQGKGVVVFIDHDAMFTHSPYFSHVICEWFTSRKLAQVPITVVGANAA